MLVAGLESASSVLNPDLAGSHGVLYTDAARAWLAGADPWAVGDPGVVFAGPPTMLLLFLPFVALPDDLIRFLWIAGDLAIAIAVLRTLHLRPWWLAFPPLFSAILLGHPEVLVLGLLLLASPLAGLAALVKPYAALPLVAERNWPALALAAVLGLLTIPFLPWRAFILEFPAIAATLASQTVGDSVFGIPGLMLVVLLAGFALGLRRFLWLATPVIWPSSQPIYKVPAIPAMPPALALAWAIPIPGMTAFGYLAVAAGMVVARDGRLPAWVARGLGSPLIPFEAPVR